MGIEPMTPVLPRLCATAAPHGPVVFTDGQMKALTTLGTAPVVRLMVGSEGFEPPKSYDS